MSVAKILKELDELLDLVGETAWRHKIQDALLMPEVKQSEHILGWFGGMGSFNDLLLCEINDHLVSPNNYDAVNDRLEKLRSSLLEVCKAT